MFFSSNNLLVKLWSIYCQTIGRTKKFLWFCIVASVARKILHAKLLRTIAFKVLHIYASLSFKIVEPIINQKFAFFREKLITSEGKTIERHIFSIGNGRKVIAFILLGFNQSIKLAIWSSFDNCLTLRICKIFYDLWLFSNSVLSLIALVQYSLVVLQWCVSMSSNNNKKILNICRKRDLWEDVYSTHEKTWVNHELTIKSYKILLWHFYSNEEKTFAGT